MTFCGEFASISKGYNFSQRESEKYHDRKGLINSNKQRICEIYISIFIDGTLDSIIICNMENDNKSHSTRLRIENRSTSVDYVF